MNIPTPQYDALHKFEVSIGIILCLLPLLLTVGYMSLPLESFLPTSDSVPDRIKDLYLLRMDIVEFGIRVFPPIAAVLECFGVFLIARGILEWMQIQKSINETIELDNAIKCAKLEPSSAPSSKVASSGEMHRSSVIRGVDSADVAKPISRQTNGVGSNDRTNNTSDADYMSLLNSSEKERQATRGERVAFSAVSKLFGKGYQLRTEMKSSYGNGPIYDIVGIPRKRANEYLVFEVKVLGECVLSEWMVHNVQNIRDVAFRDFTRNGLIARFIFVAVLFNSLDIDKVSIASQLGMGADDIIVVGPTGEIRNSGAADGRR